MPTVEIVLPRPHVGQSAVKQSGKRFSVVCAGRRWGKDTLCEELTTDTAVGQRAPVAWFSPTYKNLSDDWRRLTNLFQPIVRLKSEQEHRLELLTGGVLDMWSLDAIDASRGRAYKRVIVNEAASAPNLAYAWQNVIRPMLTDYVGDAWFASTPKGLNYFWNLYRLGQDPRYGDWASWQRPSSENPFLPVGEIEAARRELPEAVFRQEYLAEFLEGVGGLFRKVTEAAIAERQTRAEPGHVYTIGADWAKVADYTVFAVIDASLRQCVHIDRMQMVDYDVQVGRLEALAQRYRPDVIVVERTGQDALVEQLRKTSLPIRAFDATNQTKKALIDRLVLAFENAELAILPDSVMIGELQAFRAEKLPSGQLRYAAPEGQHDDMVMALALAWSAAVAYPKLTVEPDWRRDYDVGEPREDRGVAGTYVGR